MSKIHKIFSILVLLALLTLTFAAPAYAFDGRQGDKVVIAAGDVINDDLYVGANEFVLDGTVNGDLVVGGSMITINGTVNGNLMAAGQTVVINGTVTGASRIAGSVLFVGEKASFGRDLVAFGYTLEFRKGAAISRDLVCYAAQVLLAGNVSRNVQVGAAGLEIAGTVGGNVIADVGESDQTQAGPPPTMFMPQSTVPSPIVKNGLTLDPAARIGGNLTYTQTADLTFPAGVISGTVTRTMPPVEETNARGETIIIPQTPAQRAGNWALDLIRSLVTFILIGLLLAWLVPAFLKKSGQALQSKPWHSLGWGVVSYAAAIFAILLVIFVMIVGGILFGFLTLGTLTGTIIWVGLLALFALIVGFVLVTSFVAKIVFGMALGRWIFSASKSPMAEHRIWPMVVGVAITIFVIALLSFPFIPGLLGWLVNLLVILFGLGAIWIWGRDALVKKPAAPAA